LSSHGEVWKEFVGVLDVHIQGRSSGYVLSDSLQVLDVKRNIPEAFPYVLLGAQQ